MSQITAEQKQEHAYAQELIKKLQDGSSDLTTVEKNLGRSYLESQQRAMQASQEADRVEKQINMSQARMAQLRESISVEMGKSAGILESMIALRPRAEKQPKGNGKMEPPQETDKEEKEGAEA